MTSGTTFDPVNARPVLPPNETAAFAPPEPPDPPLPDPLVPVFAEELPANLAAELAAPVVLVPPPVTPDAGGIGTVPVVTPQVGVVWPAATSDGVRSPHA
jgi:hypothetical protein